MRSERVKCCPLFLILSKSGQRVIAFYVFHFSKSCARYQHSFPKVKESKFIRSFDDKAAKQKKRLDWLKRWGSEQDFPYHFYKTVLQNSQMLMKFVTHLYTL